MANKSNEPLTTDAELSDEPRPAVPATDAMMKGGVRLPTKEELRKQQAEAASAPTAVEGAWKRFENACLNSNTGMDAQSRDALRSYVLMEIMNALGPKVT